MTSRRTFMKASAAGLGGTALFQPGWTWATSTGSPPISRFTAPLRGLGGIGGIPVASPTSTKGGIDFYEIDLVESRHLFHPDLESLSSGSKVWGYSPKANRSPGQGYLGGVIVAQKNRPVRMRCTNMLPLTHPLPVDTSLPGVFEGGIRNQDNRASVHLHGGFVDWTSDGGPANWFDPNGHFGSSVTDNVKVKKHGAVTPGVMELYYPNQQSARMMWYHDHAMGTTRLNAYAGLASAYILRDPVETGLVQAGIIPSREIPLVIQDKTFVNGTDQNYTWGDPGDLWYPYKYENNENTAASPSAVPEFFGDTAIVNGVAYPFVEVEPRHYRFRILNASQARFFNLQLYCADASGNEIDATATPPAMIQIGTEGGFLPFPVLLNEPPRPIGFDAAGNATGYTLLMGPGERADVIVDFSKVAGKKLLLYSDAPSPFPNGDPENDFRTTGTHGPNTRTLLQFRVAAQPSGAKEPSSLAVLERYTRQGAGFAAAIVNRLLQPVAALARGAAVRVQNLTLNEDFDEFGRLIQYLGTGEVAGANADGPTFGRTYMDAPTETPKAGDVEIWRIFNLTGDTHPMHFHLVNVHVLSRQAFAPGLSPDGRNLAPLLGAARGPDPNERGPKETVRMNPGEMTEVIMRFDLPKVPFNVPNSPRLAAMTPPIAGHEYVWHCHILEHEEHDMMRPLVVTP